MMNTDKTCPVSGVFDSLCLIAAGFAAAMAFSAAAPVFADELISEACCSAEDHCDKQRALEILCEIYGRNIDPNDYYGLRDLLIEEQRHLDYLHAYGYPGVGNPYAMEQWEKEVRDCSTKVELLKIVLCRF